MKTITSEEFHRAVEHDPAWAATLTEPVEITEFCDMTWTDITHLSPLLHFTGEDMNGNVATFAQPGTEGIAARFWGCRSLKVAEGTFPGFVDFTYSGIERIDSAKLAISQPDKKGKAALFNSCDSLQVAEGAFPGGVDFSHSVIERISDFKFSPHEDDDSALFEGTPLLMNDP